MLGSSDIFDSNLRLSAHYNIAIHATIQCTQPQDVPLESNSCSRWYEQYAQRSHMGTRRHSRIDYTVELYIRCKLTWILCKWEITQKQIDNRTLGLHNDRSVAFPCYRIKCKFNIEADCKVLESLNYYRFCLVCHQTEKQTDGQFA